MKLLYLNDTHIKGVNPAFRTGSYLEDVIEKLQFVIKYSKDNTVDMVIHGGDFFDSPLVSLNLCDRIVDMIEEAGIPWKVVRGNHDEIGHNPNLSGASILDHIFRRSGLIQHLDKHYYPDEKLYIQGYDYHHRIEEEIREKGLFSGNCVKAIAVVHAFLTHGPINPKIPHLNIEDIKSDYNLVLVAHNHSPFGIAKIEDTTYVNIGGFSRMTVAKSDIERPISMVFINTNPTSMKIIPVPYKQPEEVFDLAKVKENKSLEASIESFVQSLESAKVQGFNLANIIKSLAGTQAGIDKEVVDNIVERIQRFESQEVA